MGTPRHLVLFLLLTACIAGLISGPSFARNADQNAAATGIAAFRATEERPYGGPVTRDMAATAAGAAARESLRQTLIREIATRPEVRFTQNPDAPAVPRPDMAALADAVVPAHVLLLTHFASPARVSVMVAPSEPAPDATLPDRLRDALIHAERLDLYRRALEREKRLLAEYDSLSPPLLASRDGAQDKERLPRLRALINGMEAVLIYRKLLPRLGGIWLEPRAVLAAALQGLELDPENPALHSAVGEACLQLGRSHEAMEAQTRALRLDPAFARAYHSRAVAYLALRLPALAVSDFSAAIRLSPRSALYHRDRGMAYLVQKDDERMCADFYAACALGDCEKYHWAVNQKKCFPTM